jgi:hypothetical protein
MTKRLPPKGRQPWPAFILVTILLAATALISALLLDFIARPEKSPGLSPE